MHIAVIGAGNMGCLYGSNLSRIGVDVTMVDVWPEHVEAMRTSGLKMEGLHGSFTAHVGATANPDEVPKADAAIVLVNAYNTPDAAQSAGKILKEDGYALTLQNGLGNVEVLIEALGADRVMAGLTFHSGDLQEPGRVIHTNEGPTYLGELNGSKSSRLKALHGLMQQADMAPSIETDIVATMWGKFVFNCGINAICAITDLRPGHIQDVPAVDAFQSEIIQEVLALAKKKGIRLQEEDPENAVKAYCRTKFHRVSMVQHLSRGRFTEIDALNGYVVRESETMGMEAPSNDALSKLIQGLQHRPKLQADEGELS